MNRRSFLGSVIGFVAGAPFVAALEAAPVQRPGRFPYRMLFRDSISGLTVQAPAIEAPNGFRFVCEPLRVTRTICMDRVVLLTADGRKIRESRLDRVSPVSGDTLHVDQAFTADRAPASVEQLVEWILSGKASFAGD